MVSVAGGHYFITSFTFLWLAKERPKSPPPMDLTVISQQGAHARHPATVVCEEGKGVDFHSDGRRQRRSVC